jgi:hypothetical protein
LNSHHQTGGTAIINSAVAFAASLVRPGGTMNHGQTADTRLERCVHDLGDGLGAIGTTYGTSADRGPAFNHSRGKIRTAREAATAAVGAGQDVPDAIDARVSLDVELQACQEKPDGKSTCHTKQEHGPFQQSN